MKILKNYEVPTGNILVVDGDKGRLECLSLGDYGKDVNIKCDALGLSREPSPVRHTQLLPLTDKWVVTVPTQYGCSSGCKFCDVPKVGKGINATVKDLMQQVTTSMSLHPDITQSKHLNLHYARMGEPTWNYNVIKATYALYGLFNEKYHLHPVISTMLPQYNSELRRFLSEWMELKNIIYEGNAGLQLSINSTNNNERMDMFNGSAMDLCTIGALMKQLPPPVGRKITLNFAVAGYEINPRSLLQYFSPENYIIKLTPMHKTARAIDNGISTRGEVTTYHPYAEYEKSLRAAGYDVIVFIASEEEDASRITCGNAVLAGTLPTCKYREIPSGERH